MGEDTTVELYAAGLGLMLYSPLATVGLEEGCDYMPAGEELAPPLRALVEADQRIVLLGTGSPELDYVVHIRRGEPTPDLTKGAASSALFGLHVTGGKLCIRDGYDPMEWHARGESLREAPLSDGYYAVEALWIPDGRDAMTIYLFFQPAVERVPGRGWPYLEYRAREP